jgi:hypothetical protein
MVFGWGNSRQRIEATRVCRLGLQTEPTGKPVAGVNQTKDENDQNDRLHRPTNPTLHENPSNRFQAESEFRFQIVTFVSVALCLRAAIE